MDFNSTIQLINNVVLLLALGVSYDVMVYKSWVENTLLRSLSGFVLGTIGILIMLSAVEYKPGLIFDARSIVLSIGGLFFGTIPALIAVIMTASLRIYQGGVGMVAGLGVIVTTATIGVLFRQYKLKDRPDRTLSNLSTIELYLFGVIVHITMLLWMLVLPRPLGFTVISEIGPLILTIFPLTTLLLGRLLVSRIRRLSADKKIMESEDKFRALIDQAPFSIEMYDANGDWLRGNKAWEKLWNIKPEDVFGAFNIFKDKQLIERGVPDFFKNAVAGEIIHLPDMEYDASQTVGKGFKRWISSTFYPIITSEKESPTIVLVHNDITDRKQKEAERKFLETQLHQSQKLEAVGTMVGGISHELNNVLQSMFLYGELIQDLLPDNEELQTNMQHLLKDGKRAKDIVMQILTFSRKTEIDIKPQAIHKLVVEALSLERASLPPQIDIQQDIDVNCGLVLGDKTQIHQIIINLCNNAQHAMEEEGGTLTVSLQQIDASLVEGDPSAHLVELKVHDTGHGIDPSHLEKIFDPFFTTRQDGQGTGLGLSVIHGIIVVMKGKISVSSTPGAGTTFKILFPVVDDLQDEITNKTKQHPSIEKRSILLVDDESSIRSATKIILSRIGLTVDSTSNGKQALELFKTKSKHYDLIITDQSMPIMSGTELSKEIRRMGSNIPIILSTGRLGVEDMEEFKGIGITKFIQKPWTADELIELIHELDI